MKLKVNSTEKKLRGGYYTPGKMADFIINWAFPMNDGAPIRVLEPSCGDGAFLESLLRNLPVNDIQCKAVEFVDTEVALSRDRVASHSGFEVLHGDFYKLFNEGIKNEKFDLVIGNPPYIRYQYLTPEQRQTQSSILVSNGMKPNKLINSWVSFMVATASVLAPDGKMGMVIPAELMQVAYAEDLRKFLVDNFTTITVVTFEELVFPDVQQEVVLFLAEKIKNARQEDNLITVIQTKNLDALVSENIFDMQIEYKPVDHTKDKWIKYFLSAEEIHMINRIKSDSHFKQIGDIADVDIGITTGDNKYFSINKETVERYKLQNVVLPLIGRSAHSKGLNFTMEDWKDNVAKGLNAQLIYFPDTPFDEYPDEHKLYIKQGEDEKVNEGYKCSLRDRWYRVPSVYAPDAFFLRRNNTFPKFVLNDIQAVSTDTMHRIRFKDDIDKNKALLSYYNSVSFAFSEFEGRSYGGGVLEVLPGEVEAIMVPDIHDLDNTTVRVLLSKIDHAIRSSKNIEMVLDEVDRIILVEFIGMSVHEVYMFREIWRKLMKRRLERKKKVKSVND